MTFCIKMIRHALAAMGVASACGLCAAQAAVAEVALPATLVATTATVPQALHRAELRLQLLASRPLGSSKDFLSEPGPKRLHFSVLREVSADKVGQALTRQLQLAALSVNAPALLQLGAAFGSRRTFAAGDTLVFELLPGQALRLFINQAPAAEALGDARLMDVLVRSWVAGTGT